MGFWKTGLPSSLVVRASLALLVSTLSRFCEDS